MVQGHCIQKKAKNAAFKLSHLATNNSSGDPVGDRHHLKQATEEAALADLLSDTSMRVTRNEVGYDTDAAVVEAAEQTVLELCSLRHCCFLYGSTVDVVELSRQFLHSM